MSASTALTVIGVEIECDHLNQRSFNRYGKVALRARKLDSKPPQLFSRLVLF